VSALDVIQKYGVEYQPPTLSPNHTRVPASTRIIDAICAMEKENKTQGERWMAMLFEFRQWVVNQERARE
jgi:hypothetical protein